MRLLRLLPLLILTQIILIIPSAAQGIVVDRMSSPSEEEEASNAVQRPQLDHKLRFSVDFGYAHRIAKMADGTPSDLARKMRSGYAFSADLLYFPTQTFGIGAAFNGRVFDAKTPYIESKPQMHYFAAMGAWRKFDRNNKNAFIFSYSLGYLHFKDKYTVNGVADSISKGALGASMELGYDIRVSDKSFVGLKLSLTGGDVKLGTENGTDVGEDTSSINFMVGLRF